MTIRLQRRLGAWVMLPETKLAADLPRSMCRPRRRPCDGAQTVRRVLDLPGGMRIGTIHAFCQSLLRRFPLEAGCRRISAGRGRRDAAAPARGTRGGAGRAPTTWRAAATWRRSPGLASADQFGQPGRPRCNGRRSAGPCAGARPRGAAAALARAVGRGTGRGETAGQRAVAWPARPRCAAPAATIAERGSPQRREGVAAARLAGLGARTRARSLGRTGGASSCTDEGKPRGMGTLVNAKLAKDWPDLADAIAAEQQRILGHRDRRSAAHRGGASRRRWPASPVPLCRRIAGAEGQRRVCSTTTT